MLTLSTIKGYIQTKRSISLLELAKHFSASIEDIQMLMLHLIKKGIVGETRLKKNCGTTCQQCQLANVILYQWMID